MRRLSTLIVLALGLVALGGATASAAETQVFRSSFDGTGSSQGRISPGLLEGLGIDRATGDVYVGDGFRNVVDKFDASGNPAKFSSTGVTTIALPPTSEPRIALAVDNSGTASQGNFYATGYFTQDGLPDVGGYRLDGSQLGGNFPLEGFWELSGFPRSLSVGPTGTIWIGSTSNSFEGANSEGVITQVVGHGFSAVAADSEENVYGTALEGGGIQKYLASSGYAQVEPNPFQGLNETPTALAVDPVTDDIYVGLEGRIEMYHSSNAPSPPFEVLSGFNNLVGLAFDASGDLYVGEAGTAASPASTKVDIFERHPASAPLIERPAATDVHTQSAVLIGRVIAAGSTTSYQIEYGTTPAYGSTLSSVDLGRNATPYETRREVRGLTPGTTYHYRLAATNAGGTTYGPDRTFATFPAQQGADSCPNVLARKQTGARGLPDCRAFELVSAADTGGYDVESSLVAGQAPFSGYPLAKDKVLYATHSGAVPGPWNATNKGPDPYLATRTANGWVTDYEGLPADINPAAGSFSSVLGEADSALSTLAFAGVNLCSPCFGSGIQTGIPVRLPSGQLVQGMSGSLAGLVPATAKPEGKVAKYFSQDGKQLLFASKYAFEPGANTGGDLTVYARNLAVGTTEIVSTDGAGNPLTGTVSELDVSADGSRVITAKRVSVDGQGNEYVHPYLHIAGTPNGVDLAPGTTSGVLYAGMTSDGTKIFFTTADKLIAGDTDNSADLYEAAVDSSGNLDLNLVSDNNSDACNPVSNSNGSHWNTTASTANCDAVAVAGGGGVASASGAVYFLSPESLGGEGTANQPNLYLTQPGAAPAFVATLEPNNPLVLDSVKANGVRRTGDFQVTPSGGYAAFVSALPLTLASDIEEQVFRYDAATGILDCASCNPTGAKALAASAASLAPNGLSLSNDGRIFFTTPLALVLEDTGNRRDVYEWEGGEPKLISSGTSPFDSGLLSVSADGQDAFFFTHQALAAREDGNGTLTRIYDAREGGGFFKLPAEVPCAASDECHGPGTVAPAPPNIKSSGKTSNGNVLTCKKNRVKRGGKCVAKKKRHQAKKHRHTNKRRGNRHA